LKINMVVLLGDIGCFSFHPRKSITTREGGIITTSDLTIKKQFEYYRNHGANKTAVDWHHEKNAFLLPDYPHMGYNWENYVIGDSGITDKLSIT